MRGPLSLWAGAVAGLPLKELGLSRPGDHARPSIRCENVDEFSRDRVKAPPALGGLGVEKLHFGLLYWASLPKFGPGLYSTSLLK